MEKFSSESIWFCTCLCWWVSCVSFNLLNCYEAVLIVYIIRFSFVGHMFLRIYSFLLDQTCHLNCGFRISMNVTLFIHLLKMVQFCFSVCFLASQLHGSGAWIYRWCHHDMVLEGRASLFQLFQDFKTVVFQSAP